MTLMVLVLRTKEERSWVHFKLLVISNLYPDYIIDFFHKSLAVNLY